MEIILYRHAEPVVSASERISGCDFPLWIQRYNESGIREGQHLQTIETVVYTSDLLRSIETGRLLGETINVNSHIKEAGIPLLRFPAIRLKAKWWLILARSLWLLGVKKKCESLLEAQKRAKQAVDSFESILAKEGRIVVVGHGFINFMLKREMLYRGWVAKQNDIDNGFLSKTTFTTEPDSTK